MKNRMQTAIAISIHIGMSPESAIQIPITVNMDDPTIIRTRRGTDG